MRGGEVRDDDFVDEAAFVVEQFAEGCVPGAEWGFEGDKRGGDGGGVGTGQADDSEAAPAGRGGDCRYGVFEFQSE